MASAALTFACCITYEDEAVNLETETAILIWDQDAKVEHFIRSAMFKGKADDFGFVFPSPTEPMAVAVADSEAFDVLESLAPPKPEAGSLDAKSEAATTKSAATVIRTEIVGDFESTILKATDGTAIGNWLKKNGHKMRTAMEPWLDHYAKQGWYFTAFRYLGRVADKPTKAVRVSFRTDRAHYPYKMPSDTWPTGHFRLLDLYVVSQGSVRGAYTDGKPWETKEAWRAKLTASTEERMEALLGKDGKPLELPANMTVTRFKNVPEANNYERDLTFEPVPEPPYIMLYVAIGGLVAAGYAFFRKSKLPPDALNSRVN